MSIPNGVYTIATSIGPQQFATVQDKSANANATAAPPVIVLPLVGQPGVQEWIAERQSNANYTLRNLRTQKYLSYEGDAALGAPVTTQDKPREWRLQQSNEPFKFHVVVPGGPVKGYELAFDISQLHVFPTQTNLNVLDTNNPQQAWRFSPYK